MATVSNAYVSLVRTISDCPYMARCAYRDSCRYSNPNGGLRAFFHRFEDAAVRTGQFVLGSVCLLVGLVMSVTLFLVPIGVPLALLGVALLMTAQETNGQAGARG